MHAEAVKYTESITRAKGNVNHEQMIQMLNFLKQCIEQSRKFSAFLEELLQNSDAVRANQPSQTVIHHQIRESQYYIGIDQLILTRQ